MYIIALPPMPAPPPSGRSTCEASHRVGAWLQRRHHARARRVVVLDTVAWNCRPCVCVCGLSSLRCQAAIELPGIKGMWSLRATSDAPYDKFLVQSFISETRVLGIEGE